jgi:hypothetical protein
MRRLTLSFHWASITAVIGLTVSLVGLLFFGCGEKPLVSDSHASDELSATANYQSRREVSR